MGAGQQLDFHARQIAWGVTGYLELHRKDRCSAGAWPFFGAEPFEIVQVCAQTEPLLPPLLKPCPIEGELHERPIPSEVQFLANSNHMQKEAVGRLVLPPPPLPRRP